MDTMLTYNTNSKTGPVCGGRAKGSISFTDINKSIEMLNYRPTTDINEGIPRFITWYKDYYKM